MNSDPLWKARRNITIRGFWAEILVGILQDRDWQPFHLWVRLFPQSAGARGIIFSCMGCCVTMPLLIHCQLQCLHDLCPSLPHNISPRILLSPSQNSHYTGCYWSKNNCCTWHTTAEELQTWTLATTRTLTHPLSPLKRSPALCLDPNHSPLQSFMRNYESVSLCEASANPRCHTSSMVY